MRFGRDGIEYGITTLALGGDWHAVNDRRVIYTQLCDALVWGGGFGDCVAALGSGLGVVRFSVPKVGAAEWACRTLDGRPIEVGTRVIVTAVMGNELIVIPK